MKVIRPVAVTDAILSASSLPENDHPAWAAVTTYPMAMRVIRAHRIWESAIADNVGNDPAAGSTAWIDVRPTNRWAMFAAEAGPQSLDDAAIEVTLAPGTALDALALVDVEAASVRVRVMNGAAATYDRTVNVAGTTVASFLALPVVAGRTIIVTIAPIGGGAAVGKLVMGHAIDLGDTQTGPTVAIKDFSRRETDEFGATTVVERAWAKHVSIRTRLESARVDAVQRELAALRARPTIWVGDNGHDALTVYGSFKDFSNDLQIGSASFCSLTIEGLPSIVGALPTIDPAPSGASDLKVLRPAVIDDAALIASSLAENDHPAWAAGTTYALGARVIRAHRVFESVIAGNVGNDPLAADIARWVDIGPTNRWAMFDQATGTASAGTGQIAVTIAAGSAVSGLAVLDVVGATVRVQAPGFDQTRAIDGGAQACIAFLGVAVAASTNIIVTIAGATGGAAVAAGTVLAGSVERLGITENSPTAGINDYSRKTTDDFGNTSFVERAWAKRMSLRALIASGAVDAQVRRLASLRARPALWIGNDGFAALMIYGFYRDFTAEIGETVSLCSLTIEGLTTAAAIEARPPLIRRGPYDANVVYSPANWVTYLGSSWVYRGSARPGRGNPPPILPVTQNAWWELMAQGGDKGDEGEPGIPGPPGADGQPIFTWVAYANNATGTLDFTTGVPTNQTYIGIANNKASATEGTNPAEYTWSLIKGTDGVPGTPGADGQTTYTWFAYASNIAGTANFTTGAPTSVHTHIGIAANKLTATESTNPADYHWSLFKGADGAQGATGAAGAPGIQGPMGPDGQTLYTWVAYASNSAGTAGFTTGVPTTQTYIGIANNKTTATEGTNPADYTWSLMKGTDGVPGTPGANGQTTYTWFAYASNATGTANFTTGTPTGVHTYIGVAANQLSATESTNPASYHWSLIKGADGAPGLPGSNGNIKQLAFRRAATQPATPTGAGIPSGWSAVPPAADGNPLWMTASEQTPAGTIVVAWGAAVKLDGDALNVDVQQLTIEFGFDSNGLIKPGQIGRTNKVTVWLGSLDITSIATLTKVDTNLVTTLSAAGLQTITDVTASGTSVIRVQYGVFDVKRTVQITRKDDPAPPPAGNIASSMQLPNPVTSTGFPTPTAGIRVVADASGQVQLTGGGQFYFDIPPVAGTMTGFLYIKGVYRVAGSAGAWSDFGASVQSSQASSYRLSGPEGETGQNPGSVSISQTKTGLTANTEYEFAIVARREGPSGSQPARPYGTVTFKQPGA